MTEADNWVEDLEENAAIARVFQNLNIYGERIGESGRNSEEGLSNERVDFVALPCGHRMPTDYIFSWFKYYIKQKKAEFSCPCFNVEGESCSVNLSYQEICQLMPLTDEQREFLEESLASLVARMLFDIKMCPGCQSYVERQDGGNLCVRCTICTANLNRKYYFCWKCGRDWKGPYTNAVRCENDGCGERMSTSEPLIPCNPEYKKKMLQEKGNEGISAALRDFAQREEHAHSDSCFVVLMSHGDASGISGIFESPENKDEEDVFQTDEIFNCLNSLNCARLRDKPKIILIQSCRGEPHPFQATFFGKCCPHVIDQKGDVLVQDAVPRFRKHHLEKDFCCLRSCTPDTVSYRNEKKGSNFIQDTVEIFNQYAHQDDIEELFRKVLDKFRNSHPEQMPCKERTTLSKKFYLFPGL
ncbi:caspase-1-like isoform X3 [Puntigrus tetrazona]|uniref:caspase-1-like isoform X3 n=1 Tax=Puntigrus tetrazona TaxID=1606681 RepID=UPI001C8B0535|nr:caspase-1-like isoform X3 [Puntigrus tetrazona]